MYLYFDKRGVLKEIINDKALRQGDYGNDNIYIYVDEITAETINQYAVWIRFKKNDTRVSSEIEIESPAYITSGEATYIPFNPKRDLRFFEYYKSYPLFVVPFNQDLTIDEDGIDPDAYDYDMLDTEGNVSLTVRLVKENHIKTLGLIVFDVEYSTESLENEVQVEEYLSLAQWNYLITKWTTFDDSVVHIEGDETIDGDKTFDGEVTFNHNIIYNFDGAFIGKYEDETYVWDFPRESGTIALLEVVRSQTIIGNTTYEFAEGVIEVPLSNFGTSVNGIYFITFGNAQVSFVLTDDMVDLSTTYRIRIPCCVPKSDYSSSVGQLTIKKDGTNLLFYVNTIGGVKIEDGFRATIIKTGLM